MELKTKHRILGILVILGLIIILLPLFQENHDVPTTAQVSAPPFPDQAIQVASTVKTMPSDPIPVASTPQPVAAPAVIPVADAVPTPDAPEQAEASSPPLATNLPTSPEEETVASSTPVATKPAPVQTPMPTIKKSVHRIHDDKPVNTKKSVMANVSEEDGLLKLVKPVWVIQVGVYNNKSHALKMVNQLRAKGYKAFIQHIASSTDQQTRVYVGPESKHGAAELLANRLHTDMRVRGLVIRYQPLTL